MRASASDRARRARSWSWYDGRDCASPPPFGLPNGTVSTIWPIQIRLETTLEQDHVCSNRDPALRSPVEHDPCRKPASTFRGHALVSGRYRARACIVVPVEPIVEPYRGHRQIAVAGGECVAAECNKRGGERDSERSAVQSQ